jgi:hypothetical protein
MFTLTGLTTSAAAVDTTTAATDGEDRSGLSVAAGTRVSAAVTVVPEAADIAAK